jgi:hydrogenase expression/formation protein HypC
MCLAVPGKIVSIHGEDIARQARVDFGGIVKEVNLAYVPEAQVGQYVLVHVGFAISVVDEAEAAKVFAYLKEMDELGELSELSPQQANYRLARDPELAPEPPSNPLGAKP